MAALRTVTRQQSATGTPDGGQFLAVLGSVIKAAGLVVTGPATWAVSRQAFGDMTAPAVHVVQVAALVLVEGVFLASWVALESERKAPEALRLAYAIIAIVMYAVLLGVGMAHGEGMAGALFRAALGLAVGLSVYRAGVLTLLKREQTEARGVRHSRHFRRYRQKLELEAEMERLRLDVEYQRAEHARLHADRMRRLDPPATATPTGSAIVRKNGHHTSSPSLSTDRRSKFETLLISQPDTRADELARKAGISLRTAYRWKAQMKP